MDLRSRAESLVRLSLRASARASGVGFPASRRRRGAAPSFRLRNKHPRGRPPAIRVGDNDRPRSIILPGIGPDRRCTTTPAGLRRMLANERAQILFATVTHHGGRWWVSLNVEAADLHRATAPRCATEADTVAGGCGIDRLVGVSGRRHRRRRPRSPASAMPPKHCAAGMTRATAAGEIVVAQAERISTTAATPPPNWGGTITVRQRASAFPASGVQRAGQDPRPARDRRPQRVRDAGQPPPEPTRSPMPAGPSSPAYCATNRPGAAATLVVADRWYPSSKLCPACGAITADLTLADRVFTCRLRTFRGPRPSTRR